MLENNMPLSYPQKPFRFFLAISPGLEAIVASELQSHISDVKLVKMHVETGGVSFRVPLEEGIALLQRLRTPSKMFMRLSMKKTTSISDISTLINNANIQELLNPNTPCQIKVHSHKSKLHRKDIVEQKALRVMTGILGKAQHEDHRLTQQLQIRIDRDLATLSIQVHSGNLYQRGWRIQQGKASLRENLASVLLHVIKWQPHQTLLDPFCGSGTIAIEAARIQTGLQTRLEQEENWNQWIPFLQQKKPSSTKMTKMMACQNIFASDKHPQAINNCNKNADFAHVSFSIENRDVNSIEPPTSTGVIVCNPPYGLRLGQNVDAVYRCLGERWRESFCSTNGGWRVVFLSPNLRLARLVDKRVQSAYQFSQGGLNVHICTLHQDS